MRSTITSILLAVALLMLPQFASAHAELVSSTPEAGATVDAVPTSISVVFGQKLGTDGSSLTVTDASGTRVDTGNTTLDPNDTRRRTLLVSLNAGLGVGSYTVAWKTLSAEDSETAEGQFTFTVRGPAASTALGARAMGQQHVVCRVCPPISPCLILRHTDAEVFGWIKNGKPGTVMPAFGEQLSDEQIWQVVTHIRKIYTDAQLSATTPWIG